MDTDSVQIQLTSQKARDFIESGNVMLAAGHRDTALRLYKDAMLSSDQELKDAATKSWCATVLHKGEEVELAGSLMGELVERRPDDPLAYYIYSGYRYEKQEYTQAIRLLEKANNLLPNSVDVLNHLALMHGLLKQYKEAQKYYRQVVDIRPDDVHAHMSYGISKLLTDGLNSPDGGFEYSYRHNGFVFELMDKGRFNRVPPLDLRYVPDDAPIVVTAEQGVGDVLMGVSCIRRIINGKRKVIICCDEISRELYKLISGVDCVVTNERDLKEHLRDERAPYISYISALDLFFAEADSGFVREKRYGIIEIPPHIKHMYRQYNDSIGICWRGNRNHPHDRFRSTDVEFAHRLAVELGKEGYYTTAMQWGITPFEEDLMFGRLRMPRDESLFGQAVIMSNLKAVVTVDTATAHLAGIMGIPCVVLVATLPDWRWGTSGNTCKFYPTVRIVRQDKPLVWDDKLINRAMLELDSLLNNGAGR